VLVYVYIFTLQSPFSCLELGRVDDHGAYAIGTHRICYFLPTNTGPVITVQLKVDHILTSWGIVLFMRFSFFLVGGAKELGRYKVLITFLYSNLPAAI